jgi:hypothetical protein
VRELGDSNPPGTLGEERRGEKRRGEERRALEVASRQPHGSRWADFPRKFIAMVKN